MTHSVTCCFSQLELFPRNSCCIYSVLIPYDSERFVGTEVISWSHLGVCWYPQKTLFHSEISGEESFGTEAEYSTSCTSALASLEVTLLNWSEADHLGHWPPTFLAPGAGLMENSFSTDQRWGMGMASGWFKDIIYLLCALFSIIIKSAPPQIIRQ